MMRHKCVSFFLVVLLAFSFLVTVLPGIVGDPPFSANVKVSSDPGTATQNNPRVAVDSSGVAYAVWSDYRNGNWDVYFAKSTDDGLTWTDPNVRVNSDPAGGIQSYPDIALDSSGNLYVVWHDDRNGDLDIYFAKSTNGGNTWSDPDIKISDTSNIQSTPSITVDSSGTIYVVWEDKHWGDFDIFFTKSIDGGITWTQPDKRVNTESGSFTQLHPTIGVDFAGNIYVAWKDERNGNDDIYFGKSTDGGDTWLDPNLRINSDSGSSSQKSPSLGIDTLGNIYIAWQDNRDSNYDIYFASSSEEGINWTNPNIKLNTDSGTNIQGEPSLAVSVTGTIYVAWQDARNGAYDIYSVYSTNGGGTWADPNLRVDDDPSGFTQRYPSVGIGSTGLLYVLWQDNRNSNQNDIYSTTMEPVNPYPTADYLTVDGFAGSTPEIMHIISHNPIFGFTYNDPSSDPLTRYNVSVLDESGSTLLWFCNMTASHSSGSDVSLTYNTAPCPTDGPQLLDGTSYLLRAKVENITGIWGPDAQVIFHLNEVLTPTSPISPFDDHIIPASETQTLSWTSPGDDAEGDSPVAFNWQVAKDPDFVDIIEAGSGLMNESGAFSTSPSGYFYWRVNLTDGWETGSFGNQPDGYWNFTAYSGSVPNNPPRITNKEGAPGSAFVGIKMIYTFTAVDPDSDPLTWTLLSDSTWLSMGAENGTLYGTPISGDLGSNAVSVQVDDGKGGFDIHTFPIEVQPFSALNNPPTITNKDSVPKKAKINSTFSFIFTATDPDSDPLTWAKLSGPEWLIIGPTNGTIHGIPTMDNLGANNFSIQVGDGKGGFDSHDFTINVQITIDEDGEKDPDPCWILWLIFILILLAILIYYISRRKEPKEEQRFEDLRKESPKGEEYQIHDQERYQEEDEEPPPPDDEEEPPPPDDEEPPPPDDEGEPPPPDDED